MELFACEEVSDEALSSLYKAKHCLLKVANWIEVEKGEKTYANDVVLQKHLKKYIKGVVAKVTVQN